MMSNFIIRRQRCDYTTFELSHLRRRSPTTRHSHTLQTNEVNIHARDIVVIIYLEVRSRIRVTTFGGKCRGQSV